MKKVKTLEECEMYLGYIIENEGYIPTKKELLSNPFLPSYPTLNKLYSSKYRMSCKEYYKNKGYKDKVIPKYNEVTITKEDLEKMFSEFYEKNGRHPKSDDFNKNNNLPTWETIKRRLGEELLNISSYYHNLENNRIYKEYCDKILDFSNELGRSPKWYELRDIDVPNYRWFVKNCPNKEIKDYNEFLEYLGLKPRYNISNDTVIRIVKEYREKVGRPLDSYDFREVGEMNISIATIYRIWGTLKNFLKDIGLEYDHLQDHERRDIQSLEEDIKKVCEYVYETENRKLISIDDIKNSEWCQSFGAYEKRFKSEFGMSVSQYVRNLGFEFNNAGVGRVYRFEDGEITTSQYEYEFTKYLRSNNVPYIRNVKYSDFIDGYDGQKDCDYVLNFKNKSIYIEIAGMLTDCKSISHAETLKLSNIHKTYLSRLKEKEKMLIDSNVDYLILFPEDLKDIDKLLDKIK